MYQVGTARYAKEQAGKKIAKLPPATPLLKNLGENSETPTPPNFDK